MERVAWRRLVHGALVLTTLVGCFVVAASATAAESQVATLENQHLRLEIRKASPYVSGLVHKASGIRLVDEPTVHTLFQIGLVDDKGRMVNIDGSSAKESSVELSNEGLQRVARMSWSKFSDCDLAVRAAATLKDGDPIVYWSIQIENRSGKAVAWVRFPYVVAVRRIGDGEDDVLVLPALPGALVKNPDAAWSNGQSATLEYPGELSAQFVSYQDRKAGVYLTSRDTAARPLGFCVAKRPEGMVMYHLAKPMANREREWKCPYAIGLGVVQGTWHAAADLYREWAVSQPWCERPLAQRQDVPDWLKEGPLVHVCEVRTYDKNRVCSGSFYPKLLEHCRQLRAKIDGPVVAMLAGWENHRRWTAGDYFPIFDQAEAERTIALLRQEGFRPFFYLSGLFHTFQNEGADAGSIPAAEKHIADYVVDQSTQKPKVFVLNESNPGGAWKRQSYEFCVGTPAAKEFFLGVMDRTHALGVDVLQMDQTTGGGGAVCYAGNHGHEPGLGGYVSNGFFDLLQEMRRHGKEKNREFALLHEEPHEQLISFVDGFHVREYHENFWYRARPGAVGIPLFDYLYHDYALGYGGDSAGLSAGKDSRMVRVHAINLVTGRTPGIAVWSSPQNVAQAHADQITMIRNHCRLLRTPARDFLMLGRMLHPLEFDVPKVSTEAIRGKSRRTIEDPAVMTSSWQSPDGRIGHLFVNFTDTRQALRVVLDTRNLPTWAAADIQVYRSTGSGEFRSLGTSLRLPHELADELAPMECLFVELRKAR